MTSLPTRPTLRQRISHVVTALAVLVAPLVVWNVATVQAAPTTSLTVTQTQPTGTRAVGEDLTYSITVTNPGDSTVSNVVVTDDQTTSISCPSTTLAANASMICTAVVTVTAAHFADGEIVNRATATGQAADPCTPESLTQTYVGVEPYTFPDRLTGVVETGYEWQYELSKANGAVVGDIFVRIEADRNNTVTNSGNSINAAHLAGSTNSVGDGIVLLQVALVPRSGNTIEAGTVAITGRGNTLGSGRYNNFTKFHPNIGGQATSITLTSEDQPNEVTNADPPDALTPGGTYFVSDVYLYLSEAPAFEVTYDYDTISPGQEATFDFHKSPSGPALNWEEHKITLEIDGCTSPLTPVDGSSSITTPLWEPSLDVTKSDPSGTLALNETVSWNIVVKNTGNVTLDPITIDDPLTANEACPAGPLAPGATTVCTASYTIQQSDVDRGDLNNTAEVTGTLPDGVTTESDSDTANASIPQNPALTVAKSADNPGLGIGSTVNYSIEVTNTGNVTLTNIAIDDPLTADESCPSSTLAPGASITCTATYTITSADGVAGSFDNTAEVSATAPDGSTVSESDTAAYDVVPHYDLSVTKSTLTSPVLAGDPITWSINVSNNGPDTASGVVVTDVIPATVTNPVVTGCTWTAPTCDLGDLAAGESKTVTVTAVVPSDTADGTLIENTASAASPVGVDDDTSNNSDSATTAVNTSADLILVKSSSPSPFVPGSAVTYTLTVRNNGPSQATAVTVTDPIPSGLTVTGFTPTAQCSMNGTTFECVFASMAVGEVQTMTITADTDPSMTGVLTNSASVSSNETDPDSTSNTATNNSGTTPQADLRVSKSPASATVSAGESVEYLVVVTNDGLSNATDVVISDSFTLVDVDGVTPLTGVTLAGPPTINSGVGTCTATDCTFPLIEAGESAIISYTLNVDETAKDGSTIVNTASTTSPVEDPEPDNNSATANVEVEAVADLIITKTSTGSITAGTQHTYTIKVVNAGPSAISGTTVTDELASALTFTSVGSSTECTESNGTVTCNVGALSAGGSQEFTVVVDVDPAVLGTVSNTATVAPAPGTTDPDTDDNSATDHGIATAEADLRLTKTANVQSAAAGTTMSWTLNVSNNGPSNALNTIVSDSLPAQLTSYTIAPAGVCGPANDISNCDLGTLDAGQTVSIIVTTPIPSDVGNATLDNTASVTSDVTDPDEENNGGSASVDVTARADINLTKTATPNPFQPGSPVTYTIAVLNAGPSLATGVAVTDILPDAVTLASAPVVTGSDNGTCEVNGGTVNCSGDIEADATMLITVVVDTDAADLNDIVNVVTVDPPTTYVDPNPDNNTSTNTADADPNADLAIFKVADGTSAVAGTDQSWVVTVTNSGPTVAFNTEVTDKLPDEVGFVSATVTDIPSASCTHSGEALGGTITCDLGDLDVDGIVNIKVVTSVPASVAAGTTLSNVASVSSSVDDDDTSNNEVTETIDVTRSADLVVTKSVTPVPIVAGADVTWTITVDNLGPSDAANVNVTDAVPAGFTVSSVSAAECDLTVSCTFTSIPVAGAGVEIKIVAASAPDHVTAGNPDSVTNNASATSPDDTDTDNNTASVASPIVQIADIELDKVAPASVVVGSPITWKLTATNNGPSTATDVVISDVIPTGVTISADDVVGPNCTVTGRLISCAVGTMAPDATAEVTITGLVDPSYFSDGNSSPMTNSGRVRSTTTDHNPDNDTSSVESEVVGSADLTVTKTASADAAVAGTALSWTIEVSNAGPGTASDVVVNDAIPAGYTASKVTASTGAPCDSSIECQLGTLGVDETVTIVIEGAFDSDAAAGTFSNSATVTTPTPDPTPTEPVTAAVNVSNDADLQVSKTGPTTAVPGEEVSYTIEVTNAGPSDAVDVTFDEAVPADLENPVTTPSQGTCDTARSCDLGTIPVGEVVTVTVSGTLDPAETSSSISNTATASSAVTPDSATDNNSSTATSTVVPMADLYITKADSADPILAGEQLTWTLKAGNLGPSTAPGVTVSDTLPLGVAVVSLPDNCTGTHSITCDLGTMAPGASTTLDIVVNIEDDYHLNSRPAPMSNSTVVTSDVTDPDTSNSTATETTTVAASAGLALSKEAGAESVTAGSSMTWTLKVVNSGPSTATDVVVVDTLPEGVTLTSATPDNGTSCTPAGATVTCNLGDVAPDTAVSIAVVSAVSESFFIDDESNPVVNVATVSTQTPDDEASDNTAKSSADVLESADVSIAKSGPAALNAGETVTWTIEVNNAGPSTADSVIVTDTIPDGVTVTSATSSVGSCSGGVICTLGDLAANSNATITIEAVVDPNWVVDGQPEALENSASVTSQSPDPNTDNDTSTSSTTVGESATITVDKQASPLAAIAGEQITWTIDVANQGPSTARSVVIDDPIVDGVSINTISTSTGDSCTLDVECTIDTIEPDETVTVTIIATIDASWVTDGNPTLLDNTVKVTTPTNPDEETTSTSTTSVGAEADLSITKADVEDLVPAGEAVAWSILVENNGPSDAENTVVTDTLPSGIDTGTLNVSTVPAGITCTPSLATDPKTISCDLGDLPAGDTATISIEATVDSSYFTDGGANPMSNTAAVTSSTTDPDDSNNSATEETQIADAASVAIAKEASRPAVAGGEITWTLTVMNTGTGNAANVAVSDRVPVGVTIDPADISSTQGSCTATPVTAPDPGTAISCTLGTVEPDVTIKITVTGTIDADWVVDGNGSLVNTASVSTTSNGDPDTDNSSTSNSDVTEQADIRATKTAVVVDDPLATTIAAGNEIQWTITAVNDGPSTARQVVLSDEFPDGVTVSDVSPATCAWSLNGTTCDPVDLAPGDQTAVVITATVDASYFTDANQSPVTNQATITAQTPDPTPETPGTSTGVVEQANVHVTKQASPDTLIAGDLVTWTLTVTNDGVSDAREVQLDDPLPESVDLRSVEASNGATCSNAVVCELGTIEPNEIVIVTIVAQVDPSLVADGVTSITNSAEVTSTSDPEPDPATTVTSPVEAAVDLGVAKRDLLDPVVAGTDVHWVIDLTNDGPSLATGVQMYDNLPDGVTYVSSVASDGSTCTADVICDLHPIGPGDTVSVSISATVDPSWFVDGDVSTLVNGVETTTTEPDTNSDNDAATEETTLAAESGLTISKNSSPEIFVAGQDVTYTITVLNSGPSAATDVVVNDTIPSSITVTDVATTVGVCDDTVSCELDSLAPDTSATITITGTVGDDAASASPDPIINTASVSTTTDTYGNDNTASVSNAVTAEADLSLVKTAGEPAPAGGVLTWTITVTNAGPSIATDVVVVDELPSTLTLDSVSTNRDDECTTEVRCTLGSIDVGESVVITVTTSVPVNSTDTSLTNNASATSSTSDPTPDNNSGGATGAALGASIGVAKSVTGDPTTAGDNGYSFGYQMTVVNTGNSSLAGVQVTDDLQATFAQADRFSVTAVSSPDFDVNADFDGVSDTNLLAGTDVLLPGESGVVSVTVLVEAQRGAVFNNSASAAGSPSTGVEITDLSTSGNDPDPDDDDNAGNNSTPTPVTIGLAPAAIGAAKQLSGQPVVNADDSMTFTYSIDVINGGADPLNAVQVDEPLGETFATANSFRVESLSSSTFTINPDFDGRSDTDMLMGVDQLDPLSGGRIMLAVRVTASEGSHSFANQVVAAATLADGSAVSDESDSGSFGCNGAGECSIYDVNDPHAAAAGDSGSPDDPTVNSVVFNGSPLPNTGGQVARLLLFAAVLTIIGLVLRRSSRRNQQPAS